MTPKGLVFDSSLDKGRPYDIRLGTGQVGPTHRVRVQGLMQAVPSQQSSSALHARSGRTFGQSARLSTLAASCHSRFYFLVSLPAVQAGGPRA